MQGVRPQSDHKCDPNPQIFQGARAAVAHTRQLVSKEVRHDVWLLKAVCTQLTDTFCFPVHTNLVYFE